MKIIGLTDIHGDVAPILKMNGVLRQADLILVAGDITHFGHQNRAKQVMDTIREINPNVLAVTGNCDYPDIDAYLNQENLSIQGKGLVREGIGFLGVGASLVTPFNTPNEMGEDDFERILNRGEGGLPVDIPMVIVSHQPPFKTAVDRLNSGDHVGAHAVRSFIARRAPLVCLTGHIHEARGTDRIQDTVIINPGPTASGHYGVVDIDGERLVSAEIRTIFHD